jgi:hypothetical protein
MADPGDTVMSDFSSQHQKKNGSGNYPNSIATGTRNLLPYKPGQSGNPGARPKGTPSIVHAIYRLLTLSPDELKAFEPQNQAEVIALQRIRDAGAALNPVAIKATEIILDRVDGLVEKRRVIEEASASVQAKAVESFGFYSGLNAKYQGKYGLSLSREELIESILRPIPVQHQQMALEAIEEELPALMAQN